MLIVPEAGDEASALAELQALSEQSLSTRSTAAPLRRLVGKVARLSLQLVSVIRARQGAMRRIHQ